MEKDEITSSGLSSFAILLLSIHEVGGIEVLVNNRVSFSSASYYDLKHFIDQIASQY